MATAFWVTALYLSLGAGLAGCLWPEAHHPETLSQRFKFASLDTLLWPVVIWYWIRAAEVADKEDHR